MKTNSRFHWLMAGLFVMIVMACGSFELSTPTEPPTESPATQEIQTVPTDTATEPPIATNQATEVATAANAGPTCTVLQDLNLRSGPGTAYRPPLRKLLANSVITPLGFVPQG